jgi:hypothetical protein
MRKQRGITLIALVTTIIIILILSGVSISMLIGKNGILRQTVNSKNTYEENSWLEVVQLIVADYQIEKQAKDNTNKKEFFEKEFKKMNENTTITEEKDTYYIECGENKAFIDENLKVYKAVKGDINEWEWVVNNDGTATLTNNLKKDTKTDLIIPNVIDGKRVIGLRTIFSGCTNLKSVSISYGIKDMGNFQFQDCTEIEGDIYIPSSITNLGLRTFENCNKIENVELYCKCSLEQQYNCGVFFNCKGLNNVYISNNVEDVNNSSFRNCEINGNLTICNSGKIGGDAFREIKGTGNIQLISNQITSIGDYAFYYTTLYGSINIPESCLYIGQQAFQGCSNIENINIDGKTKIPNKCFYLCKNLNNVYISENVTDIGNLAFSDTSISGTLEIHNSGEIGESAFRNIKGKGIMILDFCNVTKLQEYAFISNELYTDLVILPSTISEVNVAVFDGCKNIQKVKIYIENIPNQADGGQAFFRACTSLKEVYISKNLKNIGGRAFDGCNNINTVYYEGNEDEYEELINNTGINNQALLNVNIIYNYEM